MPVPALESQEMGAEGKRGQESKFPRGRAQGPTWFQILQSRRLACSPGTLEGLVGLHLFLFVGLLLSLLLSYGTALVLGALPGFSERCWLSLASPAFS